MWGVAARVAGGLLTGMGAGKVLDFFTGKKEDTPAAPVAPAGYYGYPPPAAPAATMSLSMPLLFMLAAGAALLWVVLGKKKGRRF